MELTTQNLALLISKRLACLQQLKAIGEKQAELIAASEISSLLRLISAKQQLIVALQTIEHELTPYHSQDPDARAWLSLDARATCAGEADACRVLLEEVMALEKQNEYQMTQRRDLAASQLDNVATANKARGAYRAQQVQSAVVESGPAARTLDLKTNA